MNPYLEQHGIDVVETDLGERIIQLLHQKPSHIVMPAIHLKREEVGRMFEEKGISKEKGNYDPTYLTHCARLHLRDQFMQAVFGKFRENPAGQFDRTKSFRRKIQPRPFHFRFKNSIIRSHIMRDKDTPIQKRIDLFRNLFKLRRILQFLRRNSR